MKKLIILFSLSFLFVLSCKKEDKNDDDHHHEVTNQKYIDAMDCSGTIVAYANDVKPIIDASCATTGCHNAFNSCAQYKIH